MRTEARPPRRRWPWILGTAVVTAGLIAGGIWYASQLQTNEQSGPIGTPSATASAPDAEPTGCLGGEARDAEMVLAAQDLAPHTSNGAVEFATALLRWMHQYPVPSQDEVARVQNSALAAGSGYDLIAAYEGDPNTSGALVPNGTTFWLSTVPGMWNLESYSEDAATVTVGAGIVVEGALHPSFRLAKTFTLTWQGDYWSMDEVSLERTTEELFVIGTPYTGGC